MSTFLIEKESGFGETAQGVTVPGKIEKMGYKGVDTTEPDLRGAPHDRCATLLGGVPGKGFYQMMDGVEVGRVNVAARACAWSRRAFEPASPTAAARDLRQEDRRAPGDPLPPGRHGDQGRGQPPG